nr:MAG TPA: hypothetical protein [Caudoviricetes sp.]
MLVDNRLERHYCTFTNIIHFYSKLCNKFVTFS